MASKLQQCGFGNNLDSFYNPGSGDIMYYRKDVLNCLDNIYNTDYKNYTYQKSSTNCSSSSSFGNLNKKMNKIKRDEKYIRSL
jgi:hypothetical protein